jgi:hypothetical protein
LTEEIRKRPRKREKRKLLFVVLLFDEEGRKDRTETDVSTSLYIVMVSSFPVQCVGISQWTGMARTQLAGLGRDPSRFDGVWQVAALSV